MRGALVRVLALLALLAAGASACAHSTPFVRGGLPSSPSASPDEIDHRLLLIGDAGDPHEDGEAALRALTQRAAELGGRTTVVFLGDNVYETGMPDDSPIDGTPLDEILDEVLLNLYESRAESERRLTAQIQAVEGTGAEAIFVPGNHDWEQFGSASDSEGWARVLAQQQFLARARAERGAPVAMLPGGGCPGPVAAPLGERLVVIALDTQWWLELGHKPAPGENPTGCAHLSEDEISAGITAALEAAARDGRLAVLVAHHPLRTHGPHGGFHPWTTHVFPLRMASTYVPFWTHWFPLPVLGSLATGLRACCSPSPQDMSGPGNRALRRALEGAMRAAGPGAQPFAYASGHEHSLQVFDGRDAARYAIVSGLGSSSKASPVGSGARTLFAHANAEQPGFVQIDVLRDGRARLSVVEWSAGIEAPVEVWSRWDDASGPPR